MIRLYESDIIHILPEPIAKQASVIALGYAIRRAVRRLLEHCQNISVYAAIDTASAKVLDMLALELNTQYYEDTLDIGMKRQLIKNTLKWYMKAGTYGCVEDVILTIFGAGSVTPWYEDESGEMGPGYFDVEIDARLGDETYEKFLQIIENAKNASAHLRQITSIGNMDTALTAMLGKAQHTAMTLTNDVEINDEDQQTYITGYMAAWTTSEVLDEVWHQNEDKALTTAETLHGSSALTQEPEMILMEIKSWAAELETGTTALAGLVQDTSGELI